jgi:hypothetical protein
MMEILERTCSFCGDHESSEVEAVWIQAPKEHTGVFNVFICENCLLKGAQIISAVKTQEAENASV